MAWLKSIENYRNCIFYQKPPWHAGDKISGTFYGKPDPRTTHVSLPSFPVKQCILDEFWNKTKPELLSKLALSME